MTKKLNFEKLSWLTSKEIGKLISLRFFGLHISIHTAYCKDRYWRKWNNLSNNLSTTE